MSPSFDFIKNRFKSKSKLKPESSDQDDEEYSQDKRNYDLDGDSITEGTEKSELALEQSDRSDPRRLAELSGKGISIEDATNRLRRIEEQKTDELARRAFSNSGICPGNLAVNRKLGGRSPE